MKLTGTGTVPFSFGAYSIFIAECRMPVVKGIRVEIL
jgi:hypothetical protein